MVLDGKLIDFGIDWIIKPILMSAVIKLANKAKWGLKSTLRVENAQYKHNFRPYIPKYKIKY